MVLVVKSPPANAGDIRDQVRALGREDPLEEGTATHSSVLAGESHGQRGLAGYSPWGGKESDTTERLSIQRTLGTRPPDLSRQQAVRPPLGPQRHALCLALIILELDLIGPAVGTRRPLRPHRGPAAGHTRPQTKAAFSLV